MPLGAQDGTLYCPSVTARNFSYRTFRECLSGEGRLPIWVCISIIVGIRRRLTARTPSNDIVTFAPSCRAVTKKRSLVSGYLDIPLGIPHEYL